MHISSQSHPEDQGIGSSSPSAEHSATTVNIIRTGHLPTPQLGNIQDIEGAIKTLSRGQAVKEKICEYIQREVSGILQSHIFSLSGHMLMRMAALHQGPYRRPEHGRRPREPRQPACPM